MLPVIAYLGIGSNVGDRKSNLERSLHCLQSSLRISLLSRSKMYETEPEGGPASQPHYLNMCVKVRTTLNPFELLSFVKGIEKSMGRRRSVRWGPRLIDIDILLCDSLTYTSTLLSIPHPLMHQRIFVLRPLRDIASQVRHPLYGWSVNAMLRDCVKKGKRFACAS